MSRFKIGDKVAVYDGTDKYIGLIDGIDPDDDTIRLKGERGDGYWFSEKQCRKIVKKENPIKEKDKFKFNVGDRVWSSCFSSGGKRSKAIIVRVLKISPVNDAPYFLKFDNGRWMWAMESRISRKIKMVKKPKPKHELKFKVGDRVWASHAVVAHVHGKKIKATVIAIKKDSEDDHVPYLISFDGDKGSRFWCRESNLTIIKMVKKKKVEIKIGDRVQADVYFWESAESFYRLSFRPAWNHPPTTRWNKIFSGTGIICEINSLSNPKRHKIVFEGREHCFFVADEDCNKIESKEVK